MTYTKCVKYLNILYVTGTSSINRYVFCPWHNTLYITLQTL